ncbi:MAG: ester cyclase [Gemmatimonadales bacterium]|jgi:steroid delta-isomerase-like uncharacterized protein
MSGICAQLVEEYVERVWNEADLDALDALTSDGFVYRLGGQPPRDAAATGAFVRGVHVAFPDWRVEIRDIVAGPDRVAVRWTGSATHQGPFHGIDPTGRRVEVSGMNFYAVEGGRISAEWEQMDSLGLLHQLGAADAD